MRKTLIAVSLCYAFSGIGQSFDQKFQFELPPNIIVRQIKWADINNDSRLDIVVGFQKETGFKIGVFTNGETDPWKWTELITTESFAVGFNLIDENKDNKIDISLHHGSVVEYYYNQGNLAFTKKPEGDLSGKTIFEFLEIDMNNDGIPEKIWSDDQTLRIMNFEFTTILKDTTLYIKSFMAVDLDKNGFRDLIFNGHDNSHWITCIWYFGADFKIINRIFLENLAVQVEIGDLDHDGDYDLVFLQDGFAPTIQILKNNLTSFSNISSTIGLDSLTVNRIADFNSDGLVDIAIGTDDTEENWIQTFSGNSISLPKNTFSLQDFGDYDRDGDLDLVQSSWQNIKVYTNNLGPENKGPAKATHAIGLQVRGRMFFYWNKATDDHTPSDAITYDLKVFNSDTTIITADFDNVNLQRLLVSHGNMGSSNFALQKIQGNYNFEIQSVDNAFVSQSNSICSGVCSTCATLDEQNILACDGSPSVLTPAAPQAMWFSFSKGFLGTGDTYNFETAETDTIFSFNPSTNASCASLRLFNIQGNATDTVRIARTLYNCEGSTSTLTTQPEWKNVTWKNNLNNTVSIEPSIVHTFQENTVLTAFAFSDLGCRLNEQFTLNLSKPDLQLSGTQFQIIKGNEVQLNASGGESYQWTPASSLNHSQIANPMAKPEETTTYHVVVLDSLGCSAEGNVLVEVFEEAFIPTLFTPNGDGRNDNIKIYGLAQADEFHFAIYNREGTRLFETSNVSEATHSGWTGTVNGTTQPPGTYYWKVEGKMPKGDLLLNGKKSGAFLLVR